MTDTYVRKGFGLKSEVQETLASDYTGQLVDLLRSREFSLSVGGTTVRLAREFGFCYGVERAVDYAYQTRRKLGTSILSISRRLGASAIARLEIPVRLPPGCARLVTMPGVTGSPSSIA